MTLSSPPSGGTRSQTAIAFNPLQPTTAYFDITGMASFNQDLVNWDGSWVHAPKSAQLGEHLIRAREKASKRAAGRRAGRPPFTP